jgi:hypothetical protein
MNLFRDQNIIRVCNRWDGRIDIHRRDVSKSLASGRKTNSSKRWTGCEIRKPGWTLMTTAGVMVMEGL